MKIIKLPIHQKPSLYSISSKTAQGLYDEKPTNRLSTNWPPTNCLTNQPTKWLVHQPTNQPTNQLTDWPINWPTNQPTNWPTDWPTNLPTDQLTNQPTDWPIDQPNNFIRSFIHSFIHSLGNHVLLAFRDWYNTKWSQNNYGWNISVSEVFVKTKKPSVVILSSVRPNFYTEIYHTFDVRTKSPLFWQCYLKLMS